MLGEGKEIENLKAADRESARSSEDVEILCQTLEAASEINEPGRRCLGQGRTKGFIQASARWIDQNDVGSDETRERLAGRAGQDDGAITFVFRPSGEAHLKTG